VLIKMTTQSKFGLIYLVSLDAHLKLGFTRNLDKQLKRLGDGNSCVILLESVEGTRYIEKQLHEMLDTGVNGFYDFEDEDLIKGVMHSVSLVLDRS
jgi:hypothetical protein